MADHSIWRTLSQKIGPHHSLDPTFSPTVPVQLYTIPTSILINVNQLNIFFFYQLGMDNFSLMQNVETKFRLGQFCMYRFHVFPPKYVSAWMDIVLDVTYSVKIGNPLLKCFSAPQRICKPGSDLHTFPVTRISRQFCMSFCESSTTVGGASSSLKLLLPVFG